MKASPVRSHARPLDARARGGAPVLATQRPRELWRPALRVLPLGLLLAACGEGAGSPPPDTGATDTTTSAASGTDPMTAGSIGTNSGSTTHDHADSTGSSGGAPEPPPPLPWTTECIYANNDLSELDPAIECVGLEVPLDWDDIDSERITVTAYKIPTTAASRRGQFWMLDGGPGGSGLGLVGDTERTAALTAAGWDVLVISHRGTLSSPRLECLAPSAPSCRTELEREWGDLLRHFNTSQAAHDLAALIDRERRVPDDPVVVYGVSYGTMWAMHYGALHPEQPDALVLDSLLPSEVEVLTQEVEQATSAEAMLQRCISDPACGPTLPYRTGREFAEAVVSAVDDGDCGGQDDGVWLDTLYRFELGVLLNGDTRDYLPLLAALLASCTPETSELYASAITDLFQLGFDRRAPVGPIIDPVRFGPPWDARSYEIDPSLYFSDELQWLVMGTTILRDGQDPGPVTEEAKNFLVGLGFAELFLDTHETWSSLPDIAPLPPFPDEVPTLVLSGQFDLQTPLGWATALEQGFGGEHQRLLVFDTANHYVIGSGNTAEQEPCALNIMLEFAADPRADFDTACMDEMPEVDPGLQRPDLRETSAAVFGTDDPWSLVP